MILFNKNIDEDYQAMKDGIESGLLSIERLNEAVLRILTTKMANGLFEKLNEFMICQLLDVKNIKNLLINVQVKQ